MKIPKYQFGIFRQSRRKLCCFLIFICICAVVISESVEARSSNSSFLRINSDARGAAMADAQGALTGDVYSMYWNPAGLTDVLFKEFGASYQRAFHGLNYSFLGYATPTERLGTIAGQLFFLSSGPITATYENLDGSYAGKGDSFSVADLGIGISQAKAITESLYYGVSLKLISHNIMDQHALSIAGDAGFIYQSLKEELRIGAVIQNFSTEYKFINEYLREPWNIKLAGLYDFTNIPLIVTADYNLISGYPDTLGIGAEFTILDMIALRAGVKLPPPSGLLSGLNAGLGINLFDLYQLDYCISFHSALGVNQRFSLILKF